MGSALVGVLVMEPIFFPMMFHRAFVFFFVAFWDFPAKILRGPGNSFINCVARSVDPSAGGKCQFVNT